MSGRCAIVFHSTTSLHNTPNTEGAHPHGNQVRQLRRRQLGLRLPRDPCRADRRFRHRGPQPADLPHHLLRLRLRRARQAALRPGRPRPDLRPADQPHPGGTGEPAARPGGRRPRRRLRLRPGRRDRRDPQPRQRRRPHRHLRPSLRRHRDPLRCHPAPPRHRRDLRRGRRQPPGLAGRGEAEHQGLLRRDLRQPAGRCPRHSGRRGAGTQEQRPADRRQHHRHRRLVRPWISVPTSSWPR